MNNQQIINEVHKIVYPYYSFEYDDIKTGNDILTPKEDMPEIIKNLKTIHFKFRCKFSDLNKKHFSNNIFTKEFNDEMLENVCKLNVGNVYLIKYDCIGLFIVISVNNFCDENNEKIVKTFENINSKLIVGHQIDFSKFGKEKNTKIFANKHIQTD